MDFLGILGLILGILLLVLFCAVRYRVDGKKDDGLEGNVRIAWLFNIISLVIRYQDGLLVQAKLFGKTVWKLDGKAGEKDGSSEVKEAGEEEKTGGIDRRDTAEALQKELNALEAERDRWLTGETAAEEIRKTEQKQQRIYEETGDKQADKKTGDKSSETGEEEKKSLWEKIKDRIAAWIEKLRFSFSEICGKLRQIEEKRQWLLEKWDCLLEMVHDPANQASVRLILRQVKKIFRHILPRKGTVSLTFGREDPYLMGKVLSYASIAYPFTHKFLTLYPVFGENRLEGEVHIRGRIRLGVILGHVLRLLFNKNIRQKLRRLYGR